MIAALLLFINPEMLVHPPLLAHGHARQVLIIGDDSPLPEVSRHRTLERVITAKEPASLPKEGDHQYDVILCNCAPPNGAEFYKECLRILKPDGILVVQNSASQTEQIVQIFRDCAPLFREQRLYLAGATSFSWISNDPTYCRVGKRLLESRLKQNVEGTLKYYTPSIHQAAFALPAYLESAIKALKLPVGAGPTTAPPRDGSARSPKKRG